MVKVINNNGLEVNILHFQGKSKEILRNTFTFIEDNIVLDKNINKELSFVSCWTDDNKCCLYKQLKKFNITLINALPNDYDYSQHWDMRNKIYFYIDCLKNKVNTDVVLLLDGYDVLLSSTESILEKFKETGYRIIFNTTYNNYPNENIDYIENRRHLGFFQYFNAGCCIGYREDLIKFYTECLNYIDIPNPVRSEQKVLRHCFANYSNDTQQKFVWLDVDRNIFHTMAYTNPIYNEETNTIQILDEDPNTKINFEDFPVSVEELRVIYDKYNNDDFCIKFRVECDNDELNRFLKDTISVYGKKNWLQIKLLRFNHNMDLKNYLKDLIKIVTNIKITLSNSSGSEFFCWELQNCTFSNILDCCLDITNGNYKEEKEYIYISFSYNEQKHYNM